MENMEGGLDYLKSVVIEDKLGLCEDLETQMQNVVRASLSKCFWH
jgi:nitrite reductase (NADH) large subunit